MSGEPPARSDIPDPVAYAQALDRFVAAVTLGHDAARRGWNEAQTRAHAFSRFAPRCPDLVSVAVAAWREELGGPAGLLGFCAHRPGGTPAAPVPPCLAFAITATSKQALDAIRASPFTGEVPLDAVLQRVSLANATSHPLAVRVAAGEPVRSFLPSTAAARTRRQPQPNTAHGPDA